MGIGNQKPGLGLWCSVAFSILLHSSVDRSGRIFNEIYFLFIMVISQGNPRIILVKSVTLRNRLGPTGGKPADYPNVISSFERSFQVSGIENPRNIQI